MLHFPANAGFPVELSDTFVLAPFHGLFAPGADYGLGHTVSLLPAARVGCVGRRWASLPQAVQLGHACRANISKYGPGLTISIHSRIWAGFIEWPVLGA